MNGPEHYAEGERLLASCTNYSHGETRQSVTTEALAHFTAAHVALLVATHQPGSVAWQEATKPARAEGDQP